MARIGKFFFFDGSENLATVFYYHVRSNGGVVESIGCVDNTPSFLEQSSFLLSPSGYKEDTVYTQKPIGATGNLTFTRGSDAWRTNVQGLLQRTPYNLVQYSNDLSNVSWTKTSVTITPDSTVAPNGTLTADLVTFTATNGYVLRTQPIAPATQYTFSAYFKNNTFAAGETMFFRLSDGVIAPAIATVNIVNKTATYNTNPSAWTNLSGVVEEVGNDWFRVSVTATSVNGGNGWIEIFTNGFAKSLYVWGFQVVEGAYPLEYFPTTDRLDVPRIDYSYGTCPALLLEPQRTNIALYSEQFDNAYWLKSNTNATANTTTSPDGTTNADTFSANGTTSAHALYKEIFATSGVAYTATIYAKANTGRYLMVRIMTSSTTIRYGVTVDLQNGSITQTSVTSTPPTGTSSSVTNVGNGWYRISLTMNSTNTTIGLLVESSNTGTPTLDAFLDYSYLGSESYYIYGAQVELGAYPTSYIKTEATTVTRLADSFSRNNIYTNNLITSVGGTWYIELRNNIPYTRDGFGALYLGTQLLTTSTTGDGFLIRRNDTSLARLTVQSYIAGSGTSLYITQTDTVKIAIKWNGTTCDVFHNGTKQVNGASFTPTAMEFLGHTTIVDVPKFIQQMALFNYPLGDADCQLITT